MLKKTLLNRSVVLGSELESSFLYSSLRACRALLCSITLVRSYSFPPLSLLPVSIIPGPAGSMNTEEAPAHPQGHLSLGDSDEALAVMEDGGISSPAPGVGPCNTYFGLSHVTGPGALVFPIPVGGLEEVRGGVSRAFWH